MSKPIPARWQWCYDQCLEKEVGVFTRALIEDLGEAEAERDALWEREKDLLHALNVNGKNLIEHSDAVNELSAKNRELVKALEAFVEAFKEPDGGAWEVKNGALVEVLEEARDCLLTFGLDHAYIDAALKANAVQP